MSPTTSLKFERRNILRVLQKVMLYILLIAGALIMITPFLWSVSTSLKAPSEIFAWPPQWIPRSPHFDAYIEILQGINFRGYSFNTFKIAALVTFGQLVTCSLAGFAFAKIRFPGRDTIFLAYLGTTMIPFVVIMIPNFILMRQLGWVDTHTGLIVPGITSAYGTFLMRQFFLTFPSELEDAARLDGCNMLTMFWHVVLPNSKPILATLGVMTFQNVWNDFLWPLVMLTGSPERRTLQVGLSYLQSEYHTDWNLLMAGSVLTLLPMIVLFFFAQKNFIQSIKMSGMKG